jgi:hypothetical protein
MISVGRRREPPPPHIISGVTLIQSKESFMAELAERGKRFVKVKDSSGVEWLCPLEGLKKATEATVEEI